MKILLGFYFGIGDFISAVPIIQALSKTYTVTIAIGKHNKGLVSLINLQNVNIIYFSLFSLDKSGEILQFLKQLHCIKFDYILVSPHAQDAVTSWKIPLMLYFIKSKNTKVIGATGDKNSFFYNQKIPIDKSIPLMQREIEFVKLTGLIHNNTEIETSNVFNIQANNQKNKVIIHPGASKALRTWPVSNYRELVQSILNNTDYKIVFIGLEHELKPLKKHITENSRVHYLSDSFENVITETLSCSHILTMDSGFGHIASALGLNHYLIIGSANPNHIRPIYKNTTIIYKKILSCQPCNGHNCHIGHNYCMDIISSQLVYLTLFKDYHETIN